MRRSAKISLALVAMAAALALLPYDALVEKLLKSQLAEQGVEHVDFLVESVRVGQLVLRDVAVGADHPVSVDRLAVDFSLRQLLGGDIGSLTVDSLSRRTPLGRAVLRDIRLTFSPMQNGRRQGSWSAGSLTLEGAALPLPPLAGAGDFAMDGERLLLSGTLADAGATHKAVFSLDYALAGNGASSLAVDSAWLPWGGGLLSVRKVRVPIAPPGAFDFTLRVERVSLAALMNLLTADRATATGAVTGAIPVTVSKAGELRLHDARLASEQAGVIALAPDAIPGDNPQVEMVRGVLGNFHYTHFAIELAGGEDDKLSILLQLLGNNPDAYNGKEIKLNVRLGGDLLNLLKQTILPLADPTQLLKQGQDEP